MCVCVKTESLIALKKNKKQQNIKLDVQTKKKPQPVDREGALVWLREDPSQPDQTETPLFI